MGNIIIYQGNRLEDLADHLGGLMHMKRQQEFSLKPDVVLVNNYEMSQWLTIRVAESQGICANVRFRLFGSFAWELVQGMICQTDEVDIMTRESFRWLVFRCLQETAEGLEEAEFAELAGYIAGQGASGLYYLSNQLADLFDRYLNYRVDMLSQWDEGREPDNHGWQPEFWRMLSGMTGGGLRAIRLRQLIERLRSDDPSLGIPRSIYLFGVSCLPPLHLDILSALSGRAEIHMFVLSPCREYWLDTVSERKRAALKKSMDPAMVDGLFPSGNRLLSSLGYAGRSFLARLYGFPLVEGRDFFRSHEGDVGCPTLLASIQDDILNLRQQGDEDGGRGMVRGADSSIRIFSCHSRLREVEVLHDQLVHLFETCRDLQPHEILVMAPSIEEYASTVQAVFGAAPEERRIPFSIADLGLREADPVTRAFLSVFSAPLEDITGPGMMDILSQPCIMRRFGLDQEELSILRHWIRQSGIRRGIGTLTNSTEVKQNSWTFGLDRLFLSACMDHGEYWEERRIMPVDFPLEGGNAGLLACLSGFFFGLVEFSESVHSVGSRTPDDWFALFRRILEDFISEDLEDDNAAVHLLERLTLLVQAMRDAGVDKLDFETICTVLQDELGRPSPPRAFVSGNVLFSSLVPMRSIPFRVICLLGMNDVDFPRRPDIPAFDLMAGDWRPGDRIPREEDRYLFLETLISARERLLISYVGRREQDDTVQNPAVVVSELIDCIDAGFVMEDGRRPSEHLCIHHPLQPFSTRYLERTALDRGLISYASEWKPVNRNGMLVSKGDPPEFCPEPIPLSEEETEALNAVAPWQIANFFGNPARSFLKNRLSINVYQEEDALEKEEPFRIAGEVEEIFLKTLTGLDPGQIDSKTALISSLLRKVFLQAKARGLLPVEPMASILWERKEQKDFIPFIEKKLAVFKVPGRAASIDRLFRPQGAPEIKVTGNIGKTGQGGGLLEYRLKVYHSHRMAFWIKHLLLMIGVGPEHEDLKSVIATGGTDVVVRTVPEQDAMKFFDTLLSYYVDGLLRPLPFFPAASLEFAKNKKPKDRNSEPESDAVALEKAFRRIQGRYPGRISDRWTGYLYRYRLSMLEKVLREPEFKNLSMAVCGPFLDYLVKGR